VLSFLHPDHLGGTALTTVGGGSGVIQGYHAYGRFRTGGVLTSDHKFTGQKLDASGLYYFNARYYDPELGSFISPDTMVPDPTNLHDHNRYMAFRGNPMKYNDPSGHQASCILGTNGAWQCGNSTVGGQTQTSLVNPVTATEFGPQQLNTQEIIERTAREVAKELQYLVLVYNDDGTVNWNATIGNTVLSDLTDCAKLAGGVCGVSLGASQGAGGGVRYSLDIFADQEGQFDVFGTFGGGGYLPPVALVTGGTVLAAHIETSKIAVSVVRNASIGDMRGWSGQFGGGFAAGHGVTAEWIIGRNSGGEYWHGLSMGGSQGAYLDIHLTTTYSWSGQDMIDRAIQMIDQLRISR
jgi:RHS repeat-associated protein